MPLHSRDGHIKQKTRTRTVCYALVRGLSLIADFVKIPVFSSYCRLLSMCWFLGFLGLPGGPHLYDIQTPHAGGAAPQGSLAFRYLIYHTPTGSAGAKTPGVVTDYASRIVWTLLGNPGPHHFPLFACNKKYRVVRTYTVTTLVVRPTFHPLRSYRFHHCPIVRRCLYGVQICGFLPSRRNYVYVRIRFQLHHLPSPPSLEGGRFLVVVTHLHGGRNLPPGAEAFRGPTETNSFTLTFS